MKMKLYSLVCEEKKPYNPCYITRRDAIEDLMVMVRDSTTMFPDRKKLLLDFLFREYNKIEDKLRAAKEKREREQRPIIDAILDILYDLPDGYGTTCFEITEGLRRLNMEYCCQKISALLAKLVNEGKIDKKYISGRAIFFMHREED